MVRLGSIVVNVADVDRAAGFWTAALGYRRSERTPSILVPGDGAGPTIQLDQTDRTHLDLWAADAAEQAAEVERLEELGARRVEDWTYPDGADFVVLADPDGNLFCVIDAGS